MGLHLRIFPKSLADNAKEAIPAQIQKPDRLAI